MAFTQNDRRIVGDLARRVAEIAALPVQDKKRAMWTRLNSLEDVRPMVWINEIPWWELECDELRPCAEDEFVRGLEQNLRQTVYLWEHMRTDMVVNGGIHTPFVYGDTGYGVDSEETRTEGGDYGFGSADYIPIMKTDADIERIRMPEITPDWDETERIHQKTCDLLGDILDVQKQGVVHMWSAPWDILIRWWGITELMVDMVDRPEFVKKGISRMMDALICGLDQLEEHGLLSVGDNNHRVGSGGLGITRELPQEDYDGVHARTIDQWGTSTGQIFSEVSPEMHWEFCLKHELRWLERFGLNCYGCCEPLHNKVDILHRIPRLRRVSMSTWINVEKAVERIGRDYVFSYKPNPAVLAWDQWNPAQARNDLKTILDRAQGCVVELIMKDISTCRNEPKRLWEWCELAVEVAEEYG